MRITMRQIAGELGLDVSTVSRALRNDLKVKEPTRLLVQNKAKELGYERDPALSALNAYREGKRKHTFHSVIAWLTNYETEEGWKEVTMNREYFDTLNRLAKPRGYQIEAFWLPKEKRAPERLATILRTRGIQGIFLSSLPEGVYRVEFPWEHFAVVSLSETVHEPRVHSVQKSTFFDIQTGVAALHGAGYKHPLLAVHSRYHSGMEDLHVTAFRGASLKYYKREFPCFHCPASRFDDEIGVWITQSGADSVISSMRKPAALELTAPHIQWVHMIRPPEAPEENTGLTHDHEVICKAGLDLMTGSLQRAEYGLPDYPFVLRIRGKWHQGEMKTKPGFQNEKSCWAC